MDNFTYVLPFTKEDLLKGILREIKRRGESKLYICLKGSKLDIIDLGTSYYVDHDGRWNAKGIEINFFVNPTYIDELDENCEYRALLYNLCSSFIPGDVGYDLKRIKFTPSLSIDIDEDNDIIYDLESQIKSTSNKILKKILPEDIVIKGNEMSEVYMYLYAVENSLRIFIELVAKAKYGEGYFNKLSLTSNLKSTITKRKKHAISNKWLSFRGDNDLFYLDFKDLEIIINNNWDIFKEYFNSQDFILPKIKEMAECRNLIAHNSYISKTDRDLIKSYYNSITMQISSKFNNEVDEDF